MPTAGTARPDPPPTPARRHPGRAETPDATTELQRHRASAHPHAPPTGPLRIPRYVTEKHTDSAGTDHVQKTIHQEQPDSRPEQPIAVTESLAETPTAECPKGSDANDPYHQHPIVQKGAEGQPNIMLDTPTRIANTSVSATHVRLATPPFRLISKTIRPPDQGSTLHRITLISSRTETGAPGTGSGPRGRRPPRFRAFCRRSHRRRAPRPPGSAPPDATWEATPFRARRARNPRKTVPPAPGCGW